MTKDELLRKSEELHIQKAELKIQLELYIQKWLNGESALNNIDDLVEKVNERIDNIGKQADELFNQYVEVLEKENNLLNAKKTVKFRLGVSPDELIITDGVLGSNAEDTKILAREKTKDELDLEKRYALAQIRDLIINKKISLSEASELKNKVKLIYSNKNSEKSL